MIAARTTSKEQIDFVDLPTPQPKAGEAVVAIDHVALCGTDLHIWEDDYVTDLPLIQGHELTGVVTSLGDDIDGLNVGDRVAIDPLVTCGECRVCRAGRPNVCPNLRVLGCYMDGGLVEELAWPAAKLHRVPEGLPDELAALAEPTSIAMQAVKRGRATADDIVLVLGCGPIGLLATVYARELGATVIAVDTVAERAALALEFGANASVTIAPGEEQPSAELLETLARHGGEEGPTLVIEATGVPASLTNAVRIVGAGGRISQVGISGHPAEFPINLVPFKEIDIMGSRNSLGLIPECLELIDRRRDVIAKLITHRFPFAELTDAFETMRDRTQLVGKIIVNLGTERKDS